MATKIRSKAKAQTIATAPIKKRGKVKSQPRKKAGLERVIKTRTKLPKIFVLDTNVLLHDWKSIFKFEENDIVIPLAVLEELDKFKKGDGTINYNAREFARKADEISDKVTGANGFEYPLGNGLGKLIISVNRPFSAEYKESFANDIPDHRILSTAMWYRDNNPDRVVCLVTKDVNLRMKAKALGMFSQDYLNDHIKEEKFTQDYNRVAPIQGASPVAINKLLKGEIVSYNSLGLKSKPVCNQLFRIFANQSSTSDNIQSGKDRNPIRDGIILARYDEQADGIVRIMPQTLYGISPRNEEQVLAMDAVMNRDVQLVSLTGTAGTGKTLLAIAGALEQAADFDQILVARPVIPLKNEELGFIPGDINEKIAPFMQPLYDNLAVIKKNFGISSKENIKIEDMQRSKKLEITPLAYIRGRSLSKVFFIVDEAQNLTPHEVKTIITRAGEGTKIVFTGDVHQIDQPYLDKWSNGLTHISDKLFGEKLFEHVNLILGERSPLSELAGKKL